MIHCRPLALLCGLIAFISSGCNRNSLPNTSDASHVTSHSDKTVTDQEVYWVLHAFENRDEEQYTRVYAVGEDGVVFELTLDVQVNGKTVGPYKRVIVKDGVGRPERTTYETPEILVEYVHDADGPRREVKRMRKPK